MAELLVQGDKLGLARRLLSDRRKDAGVAHQDYACRSTERRPGQSATTADATRRTAEFIGEIGEGYESDVGDAASSVVRPSPGEDVTERVSGTT